MKNKCVMCDDVAPCYSCLKQELDTVREKLSETMVYPTDKDIIKEQNEIIALLSAKLDVAKNALKWYSDNAMLFTTEGELNHFDRELCNEYCDGKVADKALYDIVRLGRGETDGD